MLEMVGYIVFCIIPLERACQVLAYLPNFMTLLYHLIQVSCGFLCLLGALKSKFKHLLALSVSFFDVFFSVFYNFIHTYCMREVNQGFFLLGVEIYSS